MAPIKPAKRGALSQQQFDTLKSNLLDLNPTGGKLKGTPTIPFTDTKFNVPTSAPFTMLPFVGDLVSMGTIVGRVQGENIANKLLGRESQGFLKTLQDAGTGKGALGQLRGEIIDYQKSQGNKNPEFISKTALTDFFANSPKYADLNVAPSNIAGKTQPFSTRSGLEKSGFAGDYNAPSTRGVGTFETAILSGQFDDDIKTTGEFADDKITQTNIRNYDPKEGVFDPAFSRAVTLENRGVKQSDSAPGDSGPKSIICTEMYRQTGLEDWSKAMKVWYIYQKKYLTPLHQEGYHFLFRPFVNGMKKSKIITAIGNHLARRRTNHIKHILFNKKPDYLGMIYMKIAEPLVYIAGKIKRNFDV